KSSIDEVMFTRYGFSGPAILNISREVSIQINRFGKSNVKLKLNFFPGKDQTEVLKILEERWNKRPDQSVEKSLFGLFPNKVAHTILNLMEIDTEKAVENLTNNEKLKICEFLTNYKAPISATRGWNEAEF